MQQVHGLCPRASAILRCSTSAICRLQGAVHASHADAEQAPSPPLSRPTHDVPHSRTSSGVGKVDATGLSLSSQEVAYQKATCLERFAVLRRGLVNQIASGKCIEHAPALLPRQANAISQAPQSVIDNARRGVKQTIISSSALLCLLSRFTRWSLYPRVPISSDLLLSGAESSTP